jgi:hypothetical protein
MVMKRTAALTARKSILVLIVALMATGVFSCGKSATDTTTDTTYKLTHSAADPEYILSWDSVVTRCSDIDDYDKIEAFVYRGEAVQLTNGETFSIDENSPAAWASTRLVRTEWEGESFRSFMIQVMFCETAEGLDELVNMLDFPVQKEGDFLQAVIETETPCSLSSFYLPVSISLL